MTEPIDDFVTTSGAASVLGISPRRVLDLIYDECPHCHTQGCTICYGTGRRLPAIKVAGSWLVYEYGLGLSQVTERSPGRPIEIKLPKPYRVTEAGLRVPGDAPGEAGPDPEQVELVRIWIRRFCNRRSSYNTKFSSYSLKDAVRRWSGDYVTNGAFIMAALLEGYRVKPTSNKLNAYLNIALPRKKTDRHKEAGLL